MKHFSPWINEQYCLYGSCVFGFILSVNCFVSNFKKIVWIFSNMKISFAGLGPDLLYLTKNMFQPDFQVDLTTVISKELRDLQRWTGISESMASLAHSLGRTGLWGQLSGYIIWVIPLLLDTLLQYNKWSRHLCRKLPDKLNKTKTKTKTLLDI